MLTPNNPFLPVVQRNVYTNREGIDVIGTTWTAYWGNCSAGGDISPWTALWSVIEYRIRWGLFRRG